MPGQGGQRVGVRHVVVDDDEAVRMRADAAAGGVRPDQEVARAERVPHGRSEQEQHRDSRRDLDRDRPGLGGAQSDR